MLPEQGRPVSLILDDPLVYADDARLDLMVEVLSDAAEECRLFCSLVEIGRSVTCQATASIDHSPDWRFGWLEICDIIETQDRWRPVAA